MVIKVLQNLLMGIVAVLALLLIFSSFPVPGNYKLMVVESGSMEPTLKVGGLIIIKPQSEYKIDDIISFREGQDLKIVNTHRIYDFRSDGPISEFVTKGDANKAEDLDAVNPRNVLGKVIFHVPYLGYAVNAVKQPVGFFILIILPATYIIYDEIRKIKDEVGKIRSKITTMIGVFIFGLMISAVGATQAFFSDAEVSAGNLFQAGTWSSPVTWTQTTQADFEAGVGNGIDTSTSVDNVQLSGAYSKDANTTGLWHLNEGSGTTANDSSGNNNNGNTNNSAWVLGKYGNSLDFHAANSQYISIPDSSSLDITGQQITIEAWVLAYQWGTDGLVYKGTQTNDIVYGLYSSSTKIRFKINTCNLSYGPRPSEGLWHHIAGTYDGSIIKLYFDGIIVASDSCSEIIPTNDLTLRIGGSANYWFDGVIDEVRISNIARTSFPVDYFPSGTLESQVFDAGTTVGWQKLEWDETLPTNADVKLEVATSDDGLVWSAWQFLSSTSPIDLTSLSDSRYLKWQANLTTTDSTKTPVLHEVRVVYLSP